MIYQGSKARFSKYIVPIIQKYIDENNIKTFIDGMCGGCNIIQDVKCDFRIAFDINPYLIDLYKRAVYDDIKFPDDITKEDWDRCKEHPENEEKWFVAATAFFCSYFAKGFRGGYACNCGDGRDYYKERLKNFQKQIPKLKGIVFVNKDIFDLAIVDSVIYLDPPYKNTLKYDFSKNFDTDKFWDKVRDLSKNNIVLVSEQEAPQDFECIWEKETLRNIFKENPRKRATEKLFKIID